LEPVQPSKLRRLRGKQDAKGKKQAKCKGNQDAKGKKHSEKVKVNQDAKGKKQSKCKGKDAKGKKQAEKVKVTCMDAITRLHNQTLMKLNAASLLKASHDISMGATTLEAVAILAKVIKLDGEMVRDLVADFLIDKSRLHLRNVGKIAISHQRGSDFFLLFGGPNMKQIAMLSNTQIPTLAACIEGLQLLFICYISGFEQAELVELKEFMRRL
jgi:hypothetical protein